MAKHSELESLFEAIADPTRLRLINLMAEGETCVCFFVEVLGEGQPKISRHLAYLRERGVVEARRDGKWMHYRLVVPEDPARGKVLEAVLESFRSDRRMLRDRMALARACCSTRVSETVRRAPRPAHADPQSAAGAS
jgi:ArsR family transcriptional regulator